MSVYFEIAWTHVWTRKRQSIIAALGVTIGISLYIFSASMVRGFGIYTSREIFKATPHIKIFMEDVMSQPLAEGEEGLTPLIGNPRVVSHDKRLDHVPELTKLVQAQKGVAQVMPQVAVDVFYKNGSAQLKGVASGVIMAEADRMFNITSTVLLGETRSLDANTEGILIGKGIATKLNLFIGDRLTVLSSAGISRIMKVVGIFSTGNKNTDESKSYIHVTRARMLLQKGPDYVTELLVKTTNSDSSLYYSQQLQRLTAYKVEPWQVSAADLLSGDKIRKTMNASVSFAIMLVAAFGIYNILNMMITQKMTDIAILKACGFNGRDVLRIFLMEALMIGITGCLMGLALAVIIISALQKVYVGPPIGYFPIFWDMEVFLIGTVFGMLAAIGAGYWPARKAASVDPVEIFRK